MLKTPYSWVERSWEEEERIHDTKPQLLLINNYLSFKMIKKIDKQAHGKWQARRAASVMSFLWTHKERYQKPRGGSTGISNALNTALFDFFINNRIKNFGNLLRVFFCFGAVHTYDIYTDRCTHCVIFCSFSLPLECVKEFFFWSSKKLVYVNSLRICNVWHNWILLNNELNFFFE